MDYSLIEKQTVSTGVLIVSQPRLLDGESAITVSDHPNYILETTSFRLQPKDCWFECWVFFCTQKFGVVLIVSLNGSIMLPYDI